METLEHTSFLVRGPIDFAEADRMRIAGDQQNGADILFLGVIRRDEVDGKHVSEIEYSAYEPMAEQVFARIKQEVEQKHVIENVDILHSVGSVKAGEISMIVYVRSRHRAEAYEASRDEVELIKANAPVWKREVYEDGTHDWTNCERCGHGH